MPLTPRPFGLPPDLQYVLDGACECHEIMSHHHHALWRYGDPDRIDAIFNEPRPDEGARWFLRRRRRGCLGLIAYAEEIIAEMDEVEREAMAVFAFAHGRQIISEYAEFLAGWNFEDEIKGGCALPFRKVLRGTADGVPFPRTRRRLYSPAAIRRYIRNHDDWDWLGDVVAGVAMLPVPSSVELPAAFREREELIRQAHRAEMRRMAEQVQWQRIEKAPRLCPKERRRKRSIVKRAAVMAAAMLGAGTVSAFARGEPVRLVGDQVAFELRAQGQLGHLGHGGVEVSVVARDGARLAKLCVYHEDTPALDQLTAFALRVAAGDERSIVETGNLYAIEGAAADHPIIADRFKLRGDEIETVEEAALRLLRRDEPFRLASAAYRIDTAPIYREAVARALFGRRWQHFMPGAGPVREAME